MGVQITATTQVPAEVNNYYDKTLLVRAVALFVHTKWAQVRDIPRKAGTKIIKFRRYGNLAANTTPLSEGVTPDGKQLSVTDITAEALQYGDYITVTDVLDFTTQDAELTEAAQILGDQMGDSLDQLCRDVLAVCTNVQYANGTALTDIGTTHLITTDLIKKAVRTLKNGKARKLTQMVEASSGYATAPLNASYIGIIHPNVSFTLKDLTGFVKVENYANKNSVMEGEIGSCQEVRFIESTNAKVKTGAGAGGIDVYTTIIFGSNAYGTSRISGEAVKNIIKPFGSAGTADALDQRATSGWKATFVAKILNNDYIIRIETAVAA